MARFSIIVPVYNVEDYLRNCLDSILNQSYEDYEVIVVNDGTKDNSQDIIDEYVKKDNRVKGYKKKNGGLSDARNFGVGKAKGDYLLFLDSDDSINNLLLEELNKEIEKNHPEMIRFQVVKVGKDKEEDKSALFGNITTIDENDNILTFTFRANGFIKYQVRNMVGYLIKVGEGKKKGSDIPKILLGKDRRLASITAHSEGLYLTDVKY